MSKTSRIRTRETSPTRVDASLRLIVDYVAVSDFRYSDCRVRKHDEKQYEYLTAGLQIRVSPPDPIDENGTVVDGEAVVEAARRIDMVEVPTVKVSHLN